MHIYLPRWYEELKCEAVDKIILSRMDAGDQVSLPNGKLLERLLVLKMYREGIDQRQSYYTYRSNADSKKDRKVDESKAPFFKHLIPISQKKVDAIK